MKNMDGGGRTISNQLHSQKDNRVVFIARDDWLLILKASLSELNSYSVLTFLEMVSNYTKHSNKNLQ